MYKKRSDYEDNIAYKNSKPSESEGTPKIAMSVKSLSGLPKSSYSFKADPYDASLPESTPYQVLNRFNKKVGGGYRGLENLDGGNVQQYSNSNNSKILRYFDFLRLKTSINYRFRPMRLSELPSSTGPDNSYIGSGLVDQCRQAVAEATSVLQSTTFTQMGIYNYVIETDLPMGTAKRTKITDSDENDHYVYSELPDVIYASTTFYQLVLQEALNFFAWHNSFRVKMGTMIRSSWNRETPALNSLFGLFKKKSFLSLLDSLALSFPGEYIDTEWAKQVNMLNAMPSRRSNSITDPVLELQTRHVHPSVFKIYLVNDQNEILDTVFDLNRDFSKVVPTSVKESGTIDFFTAIDEAQDYLSAENTMNWARNNVYVAADADNAYYNQVKFRIDVIQLCMTTFKTRFNNIREVLDVVSRTGLITWVKGFRPSIVKDTDAEIFDNQLVNDIFAMTFGGADKIVMDNATKRWRTFALWNMYSGIPEYDSMSGGAFISLSAKQIDTDTDDDETFKYLPIMFYYDSTIVGNEPLGTVIFATNREKQRVYIKCQVVNMNNSDDSGPIIFKRLVPLASQAGLDIRVPYVYAYDAGSPLTDDDLSTLYKTLTQIFGSACIDGDYALDPDVIAVYQIEIEDITNNAIAYARATSPFRGSSTFQDEIGFSSFGQA